MRAMRRLLRCGGAAPESGAVASIAAILLGFGVVLGLAAISIDVGSMMFERRQLQNGADATALSLAVTCATDVASCSTTSTTTQSGIDTLNNANARDTANGLDPTTYPRGQCGHLAGTLTGCAGTTGALVDCPDLPTNIAANPAIPYVEVHTQTKTSGGSNILPAFVARAFGFTGETVKACARAAYGKPGSYSGAAPITFSMCEWKANTNNGSSYYSEPVYLGATPPDYGYGGAGQPAWPAPATTPPAAPLVGQEIKIYLQDHGDTGNCPNFNGHDTAGGFGYLNGGCTPTFDIPSWVQVDTGNSYVGCSLLPYYGRVIDLPVFTCVTTSGSTPSSPPGALTPCNSGTGSNTYYYIEGMAKFYLSGYKTGGAGGDQERPSLVNGVMPCSTGDRCISGWFIDGVLHNATVSGPPGGGGFFGAIAVQPAG